jgi:glycosyltransferase involved in cell wall biosynthesis
MIFNARPEMLLAERLYDTSHVEKIVMGIGMDTDITSDAQRFREKYGIDAPFILYAGRKDKGKNIDTLLKYFSLYKKRNEGTLRLVLIGGGETDIPEDILEYTDDLGFVDIQDKYDAQAASAFLCQPSKNESFSLVIMESWLCGRPVLVHGGCDVTRSFVSESDGGLYFNSYPEFEGCVRYFLEHADIAGIMAENGRKYVKDNFSWDIIKKKYMNFFKKLEENS